MEQSIIEARPRMLSKRMEAIACDYLDARKRSGQALLDAVRFLAEARSAAKYGEWEIFLAAIGLDESRARAQIRIHEEAERDSTFADHIRSGFLTETIARELLPAPPDVRADLLARDEPPNLQEVRAAKRASTPVPDQAVRPFWQALDEKHPTAHFWTQTGMYSYRSACGMTAQRPPSGSSEAGHCSSCARSVVQRAPTAINRPDGSPADGQLAEHAIVATIREKAAALGLALVWEDDAVLLYWPDEIDDLEQMDPLNYDLALEWLDGDALNIAAGRAVATRPIDTITANMAAALEAEFGIPVEVEAWPPAPAPVQREKCATCGHVSTTRLTIGGAKEPRCDDCTAAAQFTALCDRIEQLGGTIDYTRSGDPLIVYVVPPKPRQQAPLRCDAADLAFQIAAWEGPSQPAPARPAPIDWNALARRSYHLGATTSETEAWEHWTACGRILTRQDKRAYAARLLGALAPLMPGHQTEDVESLSMAISDLNECQEGSEAEHIIAVCWALLDLEPETSEATP